MKNSSKVKAGYEVIGMKGTKGYPFRIGFASHAIAKIWQARNAKKAELTDKEKQAIAIKFDKTAKQVSQEIRDNWPRYAKGGRPIHVSYRLGKSVTVEGDEP